MFEKTVLIVDDNVDSRSAIKLWLEIAHCNVIEADSGEAAVELTKRLSPQVILMDLRMPGTSGFEAISRIRSLDEGNQIPIIVFSGYVSNSEWKREALEAGANECLLKPDDVYKLKEVIMKYLPSQGNIDQNTSASSAT